MEAAIQETAICDGFLGFSRFLASIRNNFAYNLRRLLRDSDLNQKQLADKVGVSEQVVSKWINGKTAPEFEKIDRVVRALDISYGELLDTPGNKPHPVPARDLDTILKELADARGYRMVRKK